MTTAPDPLPKTSSQTVKPDNILLGESRKECRVCDFGNSLEEKEIEVTSEHTISACSRLTEENPGSRIGCLNFASAKNVCGGMMGGSLAQEECLGELTSCIWQYLSDYA